MVTLGRPSVRPTAAVGTRSTFGATWVRTAASAVMPGAQPRATGFSMEIVV